MKFQVMLITPRQKQRAVTWEVCPKNREIGAPQFEIVTLEEIHEGGNFHAVEFLVPLGKGEQLQKALQAVLKS